MIRCALDEDGCIDLLAILRIMNQISQEQAWALAYELAALMQRKWPAGNNCAIIESLAQIYIHHEGFIHDKSLLTKRISSLESQKQAKLDSCLAAKEDKEQSNKKRDDNQTNLSKMQRTPPTPPITPELNDEILRRRVASSESELIASLGMALFWALDYGIPDDEERKLNIAMEYLIVQSQKEMNLNELNQICIKRLPVAKKSQADLHYRQVCKSLVQDTIELSIFLDKIYTATMALSSVDGHHQHHHHHHDQFHLHQQLQAAISSSAGANKNNNNYNNGHNNNEPKLANDSHQLHHRDHYLRIAQQLACEKTTTITKTTNAQSKADKTDHFVADDHPVELDELGLPLASLRALKINDWARLWMQVIRELRQRGKIVAA